MAPSSGAHAPTQEFTVTEGELKSKSERYDNAVADLHYRHDNRAPILLAARPFRHCGSSILLALPRS